MTAASPCVSNSHIGGGVGHLAPRGKVARSEDNQGRGVGQDTCVLTVPRILYHAVGLAMLLFEHWWLPGYADHSIELGLQVFACLNVHLKVTLLPA